jgi:tRNA(fMet)-specific endonuclease VapC
MARYLLDTNVLIYVLLKDFDDVSTETTAILSDYSNQLYTSSIVVMEILQLYRIQKIKSKDFKNATELYSAIENEYNVKIMPFTEKHINTLSKLKIAEGHNDPFDHSIISHAITDKLILVSSDKQFENYTKQSLNFAFNKR